MRRVIYTAIIGAYDVPPRIAPAAIEADCDYLCFSDSNVDLQSPWQLRRLERIPAGAAATNRRVKFCAHDLLTEYDQALYIDGNVDLTRFPAEAFAALSEVGCVFIAHSKRRSVREEMVACILAGKLALGEAFALVAEQSRSGFDDAQGLTENRLFARRLSDHCVNTLFEAVFDDYLRGPHRDQLYLQHALQRLEVPHLVLSRQWALNTFTVRPHSGANPARGRLARVVRRLLLSQPLCALLTIIARFNYREMSHGK